MANSDDSKDRLEQPADATESPAGDDQGAGQDTPPLIDEYGEPLSNEHEHPRQRPVYKRPAFLIGAAVALVLILFFGGRYWLYARSHETTDDAFVDGHIVQVREHRANSD